MSQSEKERLEAIGLEGEVPIADSWVKVWAEIRAQSEQRDFGGAIDTFSEKIETCSDNEADNLLERIEKVQDMEAGGERDKLVDGIRRSLEILADGDNERPLILKEFPPEDMHPPARDWLIQDWLPANRITLFTGSGGLGKSRLMLQIVGKIVMGWNGTAWEKQGAGQALVPSRHKVVIASWEDEVDEIHRRVRGAAYDLGWFDYNLWRNGVRAFDMSGRGPIWGVDKGEHRALRGGLLPLGEDMLSQVARWGASLLVLDPSAAAFGDNENDRGSVREFMSYMDQWAKENKCAVLILAHPPKSDAAFSGSTDWHAAARCMWVLDEISLTNEQKEKIKQAKKAGNSGEVERTYTLRCIKNNYAISPRAITFERSACGAWIEIEPPTPEKETKDNGQTGIQTSII